MVVVYLDSSFHSEQFLGWLITDVLCCNRYFNTEGTFETDQERICYISLALNSVLPKQAETLNKRE